MIQKLPSGKFRLYSRKKNPKTGKRKNLGTFNTRGEAEKHERAVQFFKHESCHISGMVAIKRLIERVDNPFSEATVDLKEGIIRNVKLCGFSSANGRDYPADVFRRDFRKYENAPIYADHSRERSIDRKIGWIKESRVDQAGVPRGDAHLLKTHPLYNQVMEAAARNPSLFGFSHVAMCHTSYRGDREIVEGLDQVESVDLVAEPATTNGIFEGRGNHVGFKIKDLVKWAIRHPRTTESQIRRVKQLAEEDSGMYADADMGGVSDAGPPETADQDDVITDGFKAALVGLFDKVADGTMDKDTFMSKVEKLIDLHCEEEHDDDGGGKPPESESRNKKKKPAAAGNANEVSEAEAWKICEQLKFRPDRTDLLVISNTPKEQREAVAKRLQERSGDQAGERPRSHSRDQIAEAERRKQESAGSGSGGGAGAVPTEGKDFAKYISE